MNTDLVNNLIRMIGVGTFYSHFASTNSHAEWCREPKPGDLVIEVTNWGAEPTNRIGRLVSCEMEDPPPEVLDRETYDEEEWGRPWPPYKERVWRILTLDGREFRWWNAKFEVIPYLGNPWPRPEEVCNGN